MKYSIISISVSLVLLANIDDVAAEKAISTDKITISIDQINRNDRIIGYVGLLNPKEYLKYKVAVYVHTDKWYIHPYAGQGEGLSWAFIESNGTWSIETVKRRFSADKVAAVLMKQSFQEPNVAHSIHNIPNTAITIKILTGTDDYGDL